jgi:hypothetical protein
MSDERDRAALRGVTKPIGHRCNRRRRPTGSGGIYPQMILMSDGRLFYSGEHTFGDAVPSTSGSEICKSRCNPGLADKVSGEDLWCPGPRRERRAAGGRCVGMPGELPTAAPFGLWRGTRDRAGARVLAGGIL